MIISTFDAKMSGDHIYSCSLQRVKLQGNSFTPNLPPPPYDYPNKSFCLPPENRFQQINAFKNSSILLRILALLQLINRPKGSCSWVYLPGISQVSITWWQTRMCSLYTVLFVNKHYCILYISVQVYPCKALFSQYLGLLLHMLHVLHVRR